MDDHLSFVDKKVEKKQQQLEKVKQQIEMTKAGKTTAHSDDLRYPNADEIYE